MVEFTKKQLSDLRTAMQKAINKTNDDKVPITIPAKIDSTFT